MLIRHGYQVRDDPAIALTVPHPGLQHFLVHKLRNWHNRTCERLQLILFEHCVAFCVFGEKVAECLILNNVAGYGIIFVACTSDRNRPYRFRLRIADCMPPHRNRHAFGAVHAPTTGEIIG